MDVQVCYKLIIQYVPDLIAYFGGQGKLVDGGTTYFGINYAGFILHSAIHAARPDAKCIIHIHHPACLAVRIEIFKFLVIQHCFMLKDISKYIFPIGFSYEMWFLSCESGISCPG